MPTSCRVCGTVIPDESERCPGCGRSLRESTPSLAPTAPEAKSIAARGLSVVLRVLGGGALAAGALATAGTLVFGHGSVLETAAIEALLTFGASGGLFLLGRLLGARAKKLGFESLELRILELAATRGGELYATDVARSLGIATAEADAALAALADGTRVHVEVTDEGLVKYVFREVAAREGATRVRVEAPEASDVELEESVAPRRRAREDER